MSYRPERSILSYTLLLAACSSAGTSGAPAAVPLEDGAATPAAPPEDGAAPEPGAEPAQPPRSKRAPCILGADQSCNEDPAVSALWGRCTELGVCACNPGFERSPTSDLCRPAPIAP
jgi:hypothetical protein